MHYRYGATSVHFADSAYYLPNGEEKLLKNPVHPIGFDDAKIFME